MTLYVGEDVPYVELREPRRNVGKADQERQHRSRLPGLFQEELGEPGVQHARRRRLNGTGSGVFATPPYQSQQETLAKPTIDIGTYSSAAPGPAQHCNGASTMGLFKLDNDAARNTSLQIPAASGSVSLLHLKNTNQGDAGNNFDCRFYDGTGLSSAS